MKAGIALPIKIKMNSETKELLGLSKETFDVVFAPLTTKQQKELEKIENEGKKIYTKEIKELEAEIEEAQEDLDYWSEKLSIEHTQENLEEKRNAQLRLRKLKAKYEKFDLDKLQDEMMQFKNDALIQMLEKVVSGKDKENILKIAKDFSNGGELVLEFLLSAYAKEREALKNA